MESVYTFSVLACAHALKKFDFRHRHDLGALKSPLLIKNNIPYWPTTVPEIPTTRATLSD